MKTQHDYRPFHRAMHLLEMDRLEAVDMAKHRKAQDVAAALALHARKGR